MNSQLKNTWLYIILSFLAVAVFAYITTNDVQFAQSISLIGPLYCLLVALDEIQKSNILVKNV